MDQPVRFSEDKARKLLRQLAFMLATMCGALLAIGCAGESKAQVLGVIFAVVYVLAHILYLIWLGRLAYGLRRSVVYYVVGSGVFLLGPIIAYLNMSARVDKTYGTAIEQVAR